ncbi:MAG: radical SAM protein [Planctomycetota bacterium]
MSPRLLWKAGWNLGFKGMLAVERFKRRAGTGDAFPAFVMISVTDACNLTCQGCWVATNTGHAGMAPGTLDNVIAACKAKGSTFFGILGGEPLLYPQLFDILAKHPDCYFQVFTNGTLLTDEIAETMHRLGNITPLISIEGLESVSDERRGGSDVYTKAMAGLDACAKHKLLFGVATSVCKTNYGDLVSDAFLDECIRRGAHYLWYYIYRPVGARPSPELCLSEEEILGLRRFMVERRTTAPIMIVDAYWDKDGNAVCPGAMGLSHHIGPRGDIEFCPPVQFADQTVGDGTALEQAFQDSKMLKVMRERITAKSRGCVLLEDPAGLKVMLEECGARDSSGRGTAYEELTKMCVCPGHNLPGREIPEQSWLYRFNKKYWFFGFGAYG